MRILYDHQMFALQQFGGISRIFVELMKGLVDEPGVAVSWHRGWHVDAYDVSAFTGRLQAYAATAAPPSGSVLADRVQVNQGLFRQFTERAGEFDIYHPSYYERATAAIPQHRRLVVTVADLIAEKYFQELPRFRSLLDDRRALFLQADCLQVISESTRRDLLDFYPVDPARIRLTYLASDMGTVPEIPPPREIVDRPFFLYVGTRSKYKNFDVLLRAYAASPALREFNVVCFGGSGDFLEPETKFMDAHSVRGNFHYVQGDDRQLRGYYHRAVALVYTSRYEGFGLPPLEAMQCGCPVVCCPTSSLPEVVGDAALLFSPDNPEELAALLLRVAGDPELRTRLRLAGAGRAGLFSWPKTVAETLKIYREFAQ